MHEQPHEFPAPFSALLDRIKAAADRQALHEALDVSEQAVDWARGAGEQECLDRAIANRIGFAILLDIDPGSARDLQAVLMRARRPKTRYLAAYNLSLLYSQREQLDRSLFYAKLAHDVARKIGDPIGQLSALTRKGTAEYDQCYFEQARETYKEASALLPREVGRLHVLVGANLGYCLLMLDRHLEAYRELIATRRMIRRVAIPDLEARSGVRFALCYAFIELDRSRLARKHGVIALEQGEALGDDKMIRMALYLLGEVEKKAGDYDRAFAYFERLQNTYFPEQTELAHLLMAVETHRLINLKA